MRVRVLSDLHLEARPFEPPAAQADVVVLAGDIHNGPAGVEWAKRTFAEPVLYLAGNHEPYDGELEATRRAIRDAAAGSGVTVLDCDVAVIGGVRFLGCTLWTDFDLHGASGRALALGKYLDWLVDFRAIRFGARAFAPQDSIDIHRRHLAWLEAALDAPFDGPTVVITHHAPHSGSIAAKFGTHPLNPAFVTDLDRLMGGPVLWIHGHTHTAFDYRVRGTRVVCNPRGYPGEDTGFRADLVIEV
jgi:3',5'-cyclic AMP phosphodiesterase CpdA